MADLDKWTFALESDGDIAWDNDRHRPEIIDDHPAIKQDLLVALDTYEGEDPLDEEFGLDVFSAVRHVDNLRYEVTRTVEYDDYRHNRVRNVQNVDIQRTAPGTRDANVHITARLETGAEIVFIFDLFRGLMTVA